MESVTIRPRLHGLYLRTENRAAQSARGHLGSHLRLASTRMGTVWHNGMRFDEIFVPGRAPTPAGTGGNRNRSQRHARLFPVLHISMLQGPPFNEKDRNASDNVIILQPNYLRRAYFPRRCGWPTHPVRDVPALFRARRPSLHRRRCGCRCEECRPRRSGRA